MGRHEDLEIYRRAYKSALMIYKMTNGFPREELYGITSQMRRSSTSIALNIAEGNAKRESTKEFKRYLMMALGSCNEMLVLLDFAKDLGYCGEETAEIKGEYKQIAKMTRVFIDRIPPNA